MTDRLVEKWKPRASARTHLLLAAGLWSVVGVMLAGFGTRWVLEAGWSWWPWALAGAAAAGLVKSRFVLERSAEKTVSRIRQRGDGRCVGGFLSPTSWALVIVMMVGGRMLRAWVLPRGWAGVLYFGIGVALAAASRVAWSAFIHWNDGVS